LPQKLLVKNQSYLHSLLEKDHSDSVILFDNNRLQNREKSKEIGDDNYLLLVHHHQRASKSSLTD